MRPLYIEEAILLELAGIALVAIAVLLALKKWA